MCNDTNSQRYAKEVLSATELLCQRLKPEFHWDQTGFIYSCLKYCLADKPACVIFAHFRCHFGLCVHLAHYFDPILVDLLSIF